MDFITGGAATGRERFSAMPARLRPISALLFLFAWACQPLTAPPATAVAGETQPAREAAMPAAQACATMRDADLAAIAGPGSRITAASEGTSNNVAVCTLEGTLAPSIGFRLVLPLSGWTGRYLQVGCGGLCGNIPDEIGAADGCPVLNAGGFAVASTDMGHQGGGGEFGADPQKRADFAYRSLHLTAVAAKSLIQRFYGRAPRYSYFNGCSDGGREALIEAQRFPEDFDGILAGAAAMNFQVQNSLYHGWQARSNTGADGKAILVAGRLPILHRFVLAACDGLDGQKDGIVAAPGLCRFDPAAAQCRVGQDSTTCLSEPEVAAARRLYDGPRDPATGERLTVGGPLPGSELAWAGVFVPQAPDQPIASEHFALDALRWLVFEDGPFADFALKDLAFDRATFDRLRPRHPLFDATNPDLSAFLRRGGKLILWHGLADPHISPVNSVAYYAAVRRTVGSTAADAAVRLYLLPGVHHCSGGEGPSSIDLLTPMMAWVERGEAPDAIAAGPAAGRTSFGQPPGAGQGGPPAGMRPPPAEPAQPKRSWPIYPYPHVAQYAGGDPDLPSSYRRGMAASIIVPRWAGEDFYRPYTPRAR